MVAIWVRQFDSFILGKRELSKVNQFNKKSLWLKKADECLLGSKRLYYNWQKGCFRKCQHWDKDCFWHEEYLKVHLVSWVQVQGYCSRYEFADNRQRILERSRTFGTWRLLSPLSQKITQTPQNDSPFRMPPRVLSVKLEDGYYLVVWGWGGVG